MFTSTVFPYPGPNTRSALYLSAQVRKIASKSFASGGTADIWRGELTADSGHVIPVQTHFLTLRPFLKHPFKLQLRSSNDSMSLTGQRYNPIRTLPFLFV